MYGGRLSYFFQLGKGAAPPDLYKILRMSINSRWANNLTIIDAIYAQAHPRGKYRRHYGPHMAQLLSTSIASRSSK